MTKLYYQFPKTWFGDCMPFGKDDKFFLFHQRDNRKPGPFGEPFGWDLATTSDFVNYEDCGVAIPRGTDEEQDQFIFAGSVFEGEGQYHAFYTGYNRDYPQQGKASQVLMHAVSDDLYHWTKTQEALTFYPQDGYDPDDWRDPWVIRDEEKDEYLLILGARKKGPKTQQTGRTVKFVSKDLKNWEFQGDFWAPDLYTMHEMPDLFKIGDWWYHIVTEYSDRSKMIYRMSKSLEGPWIAPQDDAFDGRAYYAGRTFALNGQRILFGWVPTKEECDDKKNFEWAGTFVAHEVCQRADGTLGVKIPDTVWNAFCNRRLISDFTIGEMGKKCEKIVENVCKDLYSFEADVCFSEGTRTFGIRVKENEENQQAYQYMFHVAENRYVFEKNPNWPWFDCMNIGLERPITLTAGTSYHVQLIVDDTISTLYVNGVALNARMYTQPGDALSLFVTGGKLEVSNCSIAHDIKK
ncbi:MAG: GH32 C-terminal domain-containing protein [Lachnospiraceae bacterium]|jgi:beta-fructofuranosidase|nr:GH32 C-terminal domain-containing protein [Lachnospiraceae bacterium]MDD3616269.1 GH32 C-terminal domain-containing protein [Lachnospiraceae bacterium]